MDNLVETCGFPGILYLNTYKREMLLLNIGLLALALALNVGEDDWILKEGLSGSLSMKDIRAAITENDLNRPKAIEALHHILLGLQSS